MSAKRFSEFTKIPLGQKMQVVGLVGADNTISEDQIYLLSEPEIASIKDAIKITADKIQALEDAETPTKADIDALKEEDVALQGSIDIVSDSLITTQGKLSLLEQDVSNISDLVHQDGLDITALKAEDVVLDASITATQQAVMTLSDEQVVLEAEVQNLKTKVDSISELPTRKKSELVFTGINKQLVANTDYNLINWLKSLTPASGTFTPFFNTVSDKLNAFADNASMPFKLTLTGSWAGTSTQNKSIQIDFVGSMGNRIVKSRDESVTTDVLSFPTFFSIEPTGFIVTNGTAITIRSNGATFTVTGVTLIAEQVTTLTTISVK